MMLLRRRTELSPLARNLPPDTISTESFHKSPSSQSVLHIKPIRELPFLPARWQPLIGSNKKESPLVVFAHGLWRWSPFYFQMDAQMEGVDKKSFKCS